MITKNHNTFQISKGEYTYCFYEENGKLYHGYYGKSLKGVYTFQNEEKPCFARYECPEYGRGDFRIPCVVVSSNDGLSTDFRYLSHSILSQKPDMPLPALRNGGETLVINLIDSLKNLQMSIFYTPYEEGIVKHIELVNLSKKEVKLEKLMTSCLNFTQGKYDFIELSGAPIKERQYSRKEIANGIQTFSTTRGRSSHEHSPFCVILDKTTTEENGNAYGLNLIYSGNFLIEIEKDELSQVRTNIGLNIGYGGITLKPGERFVSPECVMVYSANGIGGMSRNLHKLYRKNLLNPNYVDKPRPIVINSWESVVFNLSEQILMDFIENAKGLGLDMVVLDDGWFGHRDNDDSSLGDWYVDKKKFPNGLKPIIDCAHENGMKFGIWFEPEMISPDSELYKARPDWAIHTKDREGILIRQQLVLDFSKPKIVNYIYESMKKILDEYEIDYIKWDMNRALTDVLSAKQYYGYVEGLYSLYEKLTQNYPHILIEGCSGGGGRFDPGILYYSPMIWTSDDTDAWERCKIQYSTSLFAPLQTMSNHVSAAPNIQIARYSPLQTRLAVASLGALGYEFCAKELSLEEKEEVYKFNVQYKKDVNLIFTGNLYRLKNPYEDNAFAQMVVSENQSEAYLVYIHGLSSVDFHLKKTVKLLGLKANAQYYVEELNETYSGEFLHNIGLTIKLTRGDYVGGAFHIKEVF